MPHYRFAIRNSDRFDDDEGMTLPDDLTAREHAVSIIRELLKAHEADWRAFTMEVTREGELVWELPFERSYAPVQPSSPSPSP